MRHTAGPCIVLALFLPMAVILPVQQSKPQQADVESTSVGDLKITPIRHASLMLQWGGQVIHVDPVGQENYAGLPKADVILITDTHGDHLDLKAIAALKKEGTATIVVAPEAAAKSVGDAKIAANGSILTLGFGDLNVRIDVVPMYNLTRGPAPGQLYHPKGRGNGYVLTLEDKRVYISGDTECIPEMKGLKKIDIAFLCMNLPYTQTPQEAAECVKAFRPRIVYPYHYRGQDLSIFTDALKDEKGVEVRLRNWY